MSPPINGLNQGQEACFELSLIVGAFDLLDIVLWQGSYRGLQPSRPCNEENDDDQLKRGF